MKKLRVKSSCCRAAVYRYGGKRRQCSACKKTWSIKPKKRGKKPLRVHPDSKQIAFSSNSTLRHRAISHGRNREAVRLRHARNLDQLYESLPQATLPNDPLIALVDGKCLRLEGKRYTLYLMLLRPVNSNWAKVMDPLFLPGYESGRGWGQAFDQLPQAATNNVQAVVSDGLNGIHKQITLRGWQHQRCQFHLLAKLQSLRGQRWSTVQHKAVREQLYQLVKLALAAGNECDARLCKEQIETILTSSTIPKWYGKKLRGFLYHFNHFRTYVRHPELRLPTTSNAVESTIEQLSATIRQTRGFSSFESAQKWLTVQTRLMEPVQCNDIHFPQK